MRYLGVDFGTKKVGLALSDEGGRMAFPHSVVPNTPELANVVAALIEKEEVAVVVVGVSHNLDGTPNLVEEDISDFIGQLSLTSGVRIERESEVYTSQEAMRLQGRNNMTDASAAAIILNSYLTKQQSL